MATLAELALNTGTELAYIAALCVSGIILIVLTAIGINKTSPASRILGGLVGVAMLSYGAYVFFAEPSSVWVFWYVFIVPIGLIVQIFKARRTSGGNTQTSYPPVGGQQPYQAAPGYPQPGPPQGQQGYPQPQAQPGYAPPAQAGYAPPAQPGYAPQAQPGYAPPAQYPAQPAQPGPHPPTPWQVPNQQG